MTHRKGHESGKPRFTTAVTPHGNCVYVPGMALGPRGRGLEPARFCPII